jgi:enoyl-CoA hydratase/carnithine racemase
VPVGRNIGKKRALDMLFTGQFIDASSALRDGLVSRVATPDKLDQETMALAAQIAAQPPQQIASGKAMFHKHMEMNIEQAYALATEFMAGALQSEDAQAGIEAFVNKKPKPDWKGR